MIDLIKRPVRLSDDSVSYDVLVAEVEGGRLNGSVLLHAMSEKDADYLVEALRAAIVNYTVDEPHTHELEIS